MINADELTLDDVAVPGDMSSAAFAIAAGVLVPSSRLLIRNVDVNHTRAGFVRIVQRMGGIVLGELEEDPGDELPPAEPVEDLDVAAGPLVATTVEPHEVPLAIDELPLVALLGCFAEGATVVRGAQELRLKETDRIATVVEGLRALGGEIEATPDGFVVTGTGGLRGGVIDSHGDHRLAMMGAIAGMASQGGVEVLGMDAAAANCPGCRRGRAGSGVRERRGGDGVFGAHHRSFLTGVATEWINSSRTLSGSSTCKRSKASNFVV